MHPRTEELLRHLDANRAGLREAVESVPPDQRERRPAPDRWSAAEILEHLARVERRVAGLIASRIEAARAAGLGPETETGSVLEAYDVSFVLDRSRKIVASEAAAPQDGLDAEAAWAALEQSRAALRETVLAGDGLALAEVAQPHPDLGPLNLYQWIAFIGSHEARHAAQIREIADGLRG